MDEALLQTLAQNRVKTVWFAAFRLHWLGLAGGTASKALS